jgi:hypothetical protein
MVAGISNANLLVCRKQRRDSKESGLIRALEAIPAGACSGLGTHTKTLYC